MINLWKLYYSRKSRSQKEDLERRVSADDVPKKRYANPAYNRKRPTVLNNEG